MRVDYTLPSLEPEKLPEFPASVETSSLFQRATARTGDRSPRNWQRELNLDARPPDATYSGATDAAKYYGYSRRRDREETLA